MIREWREQTCLSDSPWLLYRVFERVDYYTDYYKEKKDFYFYKEDKSKNDDNEKNY